MRVTLEAVAKDNISIHDRLGMKLVNRSNLIANGGTLRLDVQQVYTDFYVLAKIKEEVTGYTCVIMMKQRADEQSEFVKSLYVSQVAVANAYKRNGVGKAMYDYIYDRMSGWELLSADVNENNIISQKFHEALGFKTANYSFGLGRHYVKPVDKDKVKKTFKDFKKETVEVGISRSR